MVLTPWPGYPFSVSYSIAVGPLKLLYTPWIIHIDCLPSPCRLLRIPNYAAPGSTATQSKNSYRTHVLCICSTYVLPKDFVDTLYPDALQSPPPKGGPP